MGSLSFCFIGSKSGKTNLFEERKRSFKKSNSTFEAWEQGLLRKAREEPSGVVCLHGSSVLLGSTLTVHALCCKQLLLKMTQGRVEPQLVVCVLKCLEGSSAVFN